MAMRRRLSFALATLLALVLLVLALLLSVTHWLPRLAGIWLPVGTRIALDAPPRWRQGALHFPTLRYLADECQLAAVQDRCRLSASALAGRSPATHAGYRLSEPSA